MGKQTRFFTLSALILSAIITSGCTSSGSTKATKSARTGAKYCASCAVTPTPGFTSIPTATPTATPTPVVDDTVYGNNPLIQTVVRGVGYTDTTFVVQARKVLKLKFQAGMQDRPVAGTGFYGNYSKLGVYIQVGGLDQPTPMLSNGLGAAPAQESGILDYSTQIPSTCSASDLDCRETVTITVHRPNNDYWCLNFNEYCGWTHVYDTHPWNGTLVIQTDDTEAL